MIINDSINSNENYYRYTDQVYQEGDIINDIDPKIRCINDIVMDIYCKNHKFDYLKYRKEEN